MLFTRVRETHLTHGAGKVVLVIEPLPRLHGPVSDVLRADGADHGAHDDRLWSQASTENWKQSGATHIVRAGVTH